MKTKKLGTIMILVLMVLAQTMVASADIGHLDINPNPAILSPDSKHYGLTYGEWGVKWWQWVYSIPLKDNPLVDETGAHAANGQSGDVWFLAGKYCTSPCGSPPSPATANRTVDIPAGKAIFFPILNTEFDKLNYTGNPTLDATKAELKENSTELMDLGNNMTAYVDGVPIENLGSALTTPYRAVSPMFYYYIPKNSIYKLFGIKLYAQEIPPPGAAADGVFLMLAPLPVGKHNIHFAGDFGPAFKLDINYTVNIKENIEEK
jgi:hypothetical protein